MIDDAVSLSVYCHIERFAVIIISGQSAASIFNPGLFNCVYNKCVYNYITIYWFKDCCWMCYLLLALMAMIGSNDVNKIDQHVHN